MASDLGKNLRYENKSMRNEKKKDNLDFLPKLKMCTSKNAIKKMKRQRHLY